MDGEAEKWPSVFHGKRAADLVLASTFDEQLPPSPLQEDQKAIEVD